MPVDPSREYKEHVLANLPADITVDPKDGFFIVDGKHKFATYLQAKWYKTYITKYGYRPSAQAIMVTDGIGASAHSFLAFTLEQNPDGGTPKFQEIWDGDVFINYAGFSSLKDRWDLNGVDRTGSYNGALFVTEFANPVDGWPAYDRARGIETLQYLYWYALAAQAEGCKALYIFPPWSPEAIDVDTSTMAHAIFWRDWLKKHITIPVYVVPSATTVRDFRNYFGQQTIFSDGLHLRGPNDSQPNQHYAAMAIGHKAILLRRQPEDDPTWNQELRDEVGIVWNNLSKYEFTGLGGTDTIAPVATDDPLPSPLPLPS